MTDIAAIVASLGGMAQKRQLVARGARDLDLTNAVRSGEVLRVRNGWYSTLPTTDAAVRAVRVGGRLTGLSAIAARGGWVLGPRPLHVSVPMNAARLRTPTNRYRRLRMDAKGIELHWDDRELGGRGTATAVGLADALLRVALDESLEDAVAAFDWALHTGELDRIDFERIVLALPSHLRFIADWVDINCESLPESLARTRLRLSGHSVSSQIRTGDTESIDLAIDDVVGLEVDGEEHHLARFYKDRNKDLTMTVEGWHALRPTATHVFYDWDRVEHAIEVALAGHGVVAGHGNSGLTPAAARRARAQPGEYARGRRVAPEFPLRQGPAGARRAGAGRNPAASRAPNASRRE